MRSGPSLDGRKGLGGGLLGLAEGDGEEVLADGAACLLGVGLE